MFGLDSRAARLTWTVLVTVLGVWLLYLMRTTLFVFVLALLFAYLLVPLVNGLDRVLPWKRSRGAALAIAYLLFVGALVVAAIVLGSRVVQQAGELAKDLPAKASGWFASFQERLPDALREEVGKEAGAMLGAVPGIGLKFLTLAGNLIYVVIIPILAFFFLKDAGSIRQQMVELIEPGPRRTLLEEVLVDVDVLLAHYMRALVLLASATFVAYSIFFSILQIPYGILLAVLAAVLEFIPIVGPLTSAVLILLVCGISGTHVLAVLIFLAAYRIFQDYVLSPHLMGQGVELHPALVLFGVFAGAELAGVAGTFLSVPIMALARILYRRVTRARVRAMLGTEPPPTEEVVPIVGGGGET